MDICICFSSSSTTVFNASYSTLFMMKNLMMRNVHVCLFSENSRSSQVFHRSTFFQILLLTSQQGVKYPVSSFQAFFLNLFFFNSSTGWLGKGLQTNLAMNICINLYDGDESYCNMIISLFFPSSFWLPQAPRGRCPSQDQAQMATGDNHFQYINLPAHKTFEWGYRRGKGKG